MKFDRDHWEKLATIEVEQTLDSLPAPLRTRAEDVATTFQTLPNSRQRADGIEADTLGLFVGPDYSDQETTLMPVPPQIILFLENIWDMAAADEEVFREEVRTTYLHELGHYLGLDEDDLFDRGLD